MWRGNVPLNNYATDTAKFYYLPSSLYAVICKILLQFDTVTKHIIGYEVNARGIDMHESTAYYHTPSKQSFILLIFIVKKK